MGDEAFTRQMQNTVAIVGALLAACGSAFAAEVPDPTAVRTIAEVKSLPADTVASGTAVRIRGVVTRSRPGSMFVQDDTAGIYVNVALAHDRGLWPDARLAEPVAYGDEVEIDGVLDRGGFSPPVLPRTVRVLGPGVAPRPRPVEPGRFFRGADDGDLVEATGVVQNVINMGPVWRLTLHAAGNTLLADVAKSAIASDATSLVDGVVRVAGPAASVFTTRGEFIMPRVTVDRPEWLTVVEPARPDPFEAPLVPLDGLARFRHEPVAGHRVCTEGVVVHALPGRAIHLQDGARGIRVQTSSEEAVRPGDRVEVAGFVDHSSGVAGLVNAVIRRLDGGPPPEPIAMSPAEILDINRRAGVTALMATPGDYEGCLVRFSATLVELQRTTAGGLLVLDAAGTVVSATTDEATLTALGDIRAGSELAVTGITRLQWAFDPVAWPPRTVEGITILVRSPSDVAVVRAASWWTPRRLAALAGAVAALLAAAITWVWLLRRQVARQARALAAEMQSRHDAQVEFDAALRERNRLAANLHDTVLQTVTGIGFQLQACRSVGADGRHGTADHARIAERMVDHAIRQLRGTVWALHELPPVGQPLPEAARALAERMAEEHGAPIHFEVEGTAVPPADEVAGTLLLVAREAIHNAVRHAAAGAIEFRLHHGPGDTVSVIVRDDGRGFEPARHPGPSQGHFGIEAMVDRMQRIGGTLRIDSRPGAGTTVTASVHGTRVGAAVHLSDGPVAVETAPGEMKS